MVELLSTHQIIESLATEEIRPERLGSLIYWEVKSFKNALQDTLKLFAGTELQRYIHSVDFVEAIRRFAEKAIFIHGNIYGKQLKYQVEHSKIHKGITFLSFYTGNLDKKQTDFVEHCKYIFVNDEDEQSVNILEKDKDWLLSTNQESSDLFFDECFLIINKDIQTALSSFANMIGYRFNKHGGHYFVAHRYTNDLYKIKAILASMGQTLSIMPIIACNDIEGEEIIRIIGNDFKDEIDSCQKELFELCIPIYNFQVDWKTFSKSAVERDIVALQKNKISKTRYGSKLYKQILSYSQNGGDVEYKELVIKLLKDVNPNLTRSPRKLYKIAERLDNAVRKLRDCSENSIILGKYRQKMLDDVAAVKSSIERASKLILDEVLELKF